MKKELFDRIVAYVSTLKPIHTHTVKEDFESYCFKFHDASEAVKELKAGIEEGVSNQKLAYKFSNPRHRYVTLLYNHVKDSISVSEFETGWAYAFKKDRWYPLSKNKPIACYSKRLYMFHHQNRKPRIMSAHVGNLYGMPYREIFRMLMGSEHNPSLAVTARHAFGTKDDWEVIYNATGVKVPKALRIFPESDVFDLIRVLRNPNELSSLCMYLAEVDPAKDVRRADLCTVLSCMMLDSVDAAWLLRDYIQDHIALKRKMSLKIRSKTRIEDEHRKMTKERMIKGIKAINVAERYKILFKDSDIQAELIETKERLLEESITQDHCVATYANQINSGSCAIFCITWEDKKYTLQVNSYFQNIQFKGHRNCDAPEACTKKVNELLKVYQAADLLVPVGDDLPF